MMIVRIVQHPATVKAEIKSFASLAHTLSRLSVQKANWAREAERQGKPDLAKRYADDAAKKRFEARWYLSQAMSRKDRHYGRA